MSRGTDGETSPPATPFPLSLWGRISATLATLSFIATPLAAQPYQPQDEDERGLWMVMDEHERQLQSSHFVMRDPGLNAYVNEVFCRTVGESCEEVRIYIVRTPYFNASMAPNGVMEVWSGLFLRVRNEAQLAAVLGHEWTHYRNRHSLQMFRTVRDRTNVMSFLGIGLFVAGGGLLATAGQLAMISSIFSYTRGMEREADTESVRLLHEAGYDPMAASRIWAQIRDERDARSEDRGHDGRGEDTVFGTHPLTEDRMVDLRELAEAAGEGGERHRDRYTLMLAPHWQAIIDDQINLNDFGATRHLLDALARDGWTAQLRHAEGEMYRAHGETGDFNAAAQSYAAAVQMRPDLAEAWRGLGLALLRLDRDEEGQAALRRYLELRPEAEDAPMMAMLAGEGP